MASSYSYAVFKYVKDAQRDLTVPIGVALWGSDRQLAYMRFIKKNEKIAHISKADDLPYIDLVARNLKEWLDKKELPYQQFELSPNSDAWWKHVRDLLVHRVRVSEPLPVDCKNPETELEPLFTSLVKPDALEDATERIDSVLRNALGDQLASKFHRGHVSGYAGKPVNAMRVFSGKSGDVILDAINLSGKDAAESADEMVGKLQRSRLNGNGLLPKSRPVLAIVGYISSPGGLNGETYLKTWIEEGGKAKVFDLLREQPQFRDATQIALSEASLQPLLHD
jgi:hypothetical protein